MAITLPFTPPFSLCFQAAQILTFPLSNVKGKIICEWSNGVTWVVPHVCVCSPWTQWRIKTLHYSFVPWKCPQRLAEAGSKSRKNTLQPFLLACFPLLYFAVCVLWKFLWPFKLYHFIVSSRENIYTVECLNPYNCEWFVPFVLGNLTGDAFTLCHPRALLIDYLHI